MTLNFVYFLCVC